MGLSLDALRAAWRDRTFAENSQRVLSLFEHLLLNTMRACALLAAWIMLDTIPAVISSSTLHQHPFSNGIIQLIIEAYTEEMLREMNSIPEFQLTEIQHALLKQRMKSLYEHIRHHPALHQRYMWVGKGRPDIDPDINTSSQPMRQGRTSSKRKRYLSENSSDQSHEVKSNPQKKAQMSFPSQEICKTDRQWKQINSTHDFYGNEVEVIQDSVQQYVFSYSCVAETGPCIGISPLYESECTERYGWMYMYYKRVDDPYRTPQWGFVAAPHHCACKITPKYIPDS
ncbi:uncharacterized protein LOC129960063 [Argiope bruennichi]|uniref:Nerve growth factor-related domain-containing protein n=1 Tax=Argiope bruennichi TaxID=94029 RepID=A0A8T0FL15_ARGBR|nr:uncharacterized protein LOC129960063 [Argiope bruennichi]KAF8790070.1 hypothetical protein HNY73_005147 [Argiope bruennichi]